MSAGALEEHELAVSEMREALRSDPGALQVIPEGDQIDARLRDLRGGYRAAALRDWPDADALVMVAALSYVLSEDPMAYVALDAAIDAGDRDHSTMNLKALLDSAQNTTPDQPIDETPATQPADGEQTAPTPQILEQPAF